MKRLRFQQKYLSSVQHSAGENPLFKETKQRSARLKVLGSILTISLLIGTLLAFFYSPLTRIHTVKIEGLTTIPDSEMLNIVEEWMDAGILGLRRRSLTFSPNSLRRLLMEKYTLEDMTLNVQKGRLIIIGKERASEVLIQESADRFHLIDLSGLRTVSLTREEFNLNPRIAQPTVPVFIFYDATDFSRSEYLQHIDIEKLLDLNEMLHKSDYVPKQYFMTHAEERWYEVMIAGDILVKIDGASDPDQIFFALSEILQARSTELASIEYVDLRFGEHVYLRTK